MKTLQHCSIECDVNTSNFGTARIKSMPVNVTDNMITLDIAPSSIEFPDITANKNSEKLLVCKIKHDNNGNDTFKIQLVKDLFFAESYNYLVKQYSDYIMVNIDELIHDQQHKLIKQSLDQHLQSMDTGCFFQNNCLVQYIVDDIVYFED